MYICIYLCLTRPQSTTSPSIHRPKPRPRLRQHVVPQLQDIDDPQTAQLCKGRSTSEDRASPPSLDAPFADWDHGFDVSDDEFARAQSPLRYSASPAPGFEASVSFASSQARHPPTSSDVIDLSSESGEGDQPSEDDKTHSSSAEQEKLRPDDMKALRRMMPKVMVLRMLRQQNRPELAPRASTSADLDSDESDAPLRPGESRRRIRGRTESTRSAILGDPESSDVDMAEPYDLSSQSVVGSGPLFPAVVSSSSEAESLPSIIEPIGHQPRPKHRRPSTGDINISSDPDDDSDMSSDDAEGVVRQRRRRSFDGEVREGDLIDRMLSRTNVSSKPRRHKKRRKGTLHRSGAGGNRAHTGTSGRGEGGNRRQGDGLRVVTSGAKRHGAGRQTLLPFKRLSSPEQVHHHGRSLFEIIVTS